jgi:hypothetical protein
MRIPYERNPWKDRNMADDPTPPPGVEAIMRALDRKKRQDARWEAETRSREREAEEAELDRAAFLDHCQPATLLEYTAWMIGHLNKGGEPSHVYDYEFTERATVLSGSIGPNGSSLAASQAGLKWWVLAEVPDNVPSLYGAKSLSVIVPNGVGFTPQDVPRTFHGKCGHSNFYFMDGFTQVGNDTPVYSDMLSVLAAEL